jgi:hypothetical protein
MSRVLRRLVLAGGCVATVVTVAALAPVGFAGAAPAGPTMAVGQPVGKVAPGFHASCGAAGPGRARCLSQYRPSTRTGRGAAAAVPPAGYGPADLMSAYKVPASTSTKTVAIVDAFGYPTAESDLAVYRRTFGLPACTVASGCLRIVNQDGAPGPLPEPDFGWAVESALDLQAASAACPTCRLLLVEGNDNLEGALAAATDTAVRLGASVVSNSYGADESNGLQPLEASYDNHPGVPILASSGDFGFGIPSWPAVLPNVIAVGGTTLNRAGDSRGWTEQAWSGAGSGCSAWYDKPAWQHDPNCQMRTTADISADADPDTGLAIYDTFEMDPNDAWLVVGGTSAASPYVAGLIASTGYPQRVTGSSIYAKPASAFYDAVGGSNGFCGEDYLCTGLPGYDAPTGRGTPHGLAAFR